MLNYTPMKLNRFLRTASPDERKEVAGACNGSVGYLYLLAGRHRFASAGMPSGANSSTIVSRMDSRPAKASDSSQTAHESGSPRAGAPPNCSRFSQITAVGETAVLTTYGCFACCGRRQFVLYSAPAMNGEVTRMTKRRGQPTKLPEGWVADEGRLRHGGQASAVYVRHGDGRQGVYRELRRPAATKARERFRREVGILSERVEHRSVVVLFDWDADSDAPWYISERGDPFNAWWRDWKEEHRADPEAVVSKAIDVVRQLASALGKCHENGVVHRDVKPPNVVVKRGVAEPWPILIDFGVAYENDTPRLTESDEKVGNRRFSPDPARSRLEPVPPWLDVFALAQLVMRMLDEQLSEQKSWPRPLHWRYAQYDSGVGGANTCRKMRSASLLRSRAALSKPTVMSIWMADGSR